MSEVSSDTGVAVDRTAADRPIPKPGILDIHAYVPGKAKAEGVAEPIKLSANENALGSSPKAQAAYAAAASQLNLYPDPRAGIVRTAIAERFKLEPERLIFGCGSDEVFQLLNQVFLEPGDNMVQGEFGFSAFAIGARAAGGEVKLAKEPGYRIDVDEMLATVDERTRLVFLANPGNPTGTWIPFSEVRRLHEALPPSVVLILDGAYSEFALDPGFNDGLELARRSSNIVVTHTFSKLHGLAGLRIGWGYAPTAIAKAVLGDTDFQRASIELVEQWRPWLTQQLGGVGLEVVSPSATNFLLVGFPKTPGRTAAEAEAFLASRGLLVRGVTVYGLPDHLRITVGLEAQNRALMDALADFMRGA